MQTENKYQNGKIYKICNPNSQLYYIGSTCKTIKKRFDTHKYNYTSYLKGNEYETFISSFEIFELGVDDSYVELIELFPCSNKKELHRREGELITMYKNNVVNKIIAGRTQKESGKVYRENHKEQQKEKNKKYRENHKEQLKERCKIYRNNNKDKITEKNKIYREIHKEKITEYRKAYIEKQGMKEKISEYHKQHYKDNRDRIITYQENYRNNNKDKICKRDKDYREKPEVREKNIDYHKNYYLKIKDKVNEERRTKIVCECGIDSTLGNIKRHQQTAKHLKYIASLG